MNNIYSKILKLQLEIGATPKNGFNKFGNYKYWLLSDIFNKLKQLCKELNLVIIHKDSKIDMKIRQFNDKEVEVSYIKKYIIINLDKEESQIEFPIHACAKNTDVAKAKGSAETYAYRYFLMNLLLLSEDELDPDNDNTSIQPIIESFNINNSKVYKKENNQLQTKWEPSDKQLDYFDKYMIMNPYLMDDYIREDMERLNPSNNKEFLILMGEDYLKMLFNKLKEIRERFK